MKSSYLDLQYLKNITNNNPDVLKQLIALFIAQTPAMLDEIVNNIHPNENRENIKRLTHKVKSSIKTMGMKHTAGLLNELERKCENELNTDQMLLIMGQIKQDCSLAIDELNHFHSQLQA